MFSRFVQTTTIVGTLTLSTFAFICQKSLSDTGSLVQNQNTYASNRLDGQIVQVVKRQRPLKKSAPKNNNFIALAQQVDQETGLALETWNLFYSEVIKIENNGGSGDLSNVIALSKKNSQHHLNAARIASQMYEIAPNGNYEKTFVKGLYDMNNLGYKAFSKFTQDFSNLQGSGNRQAVLKEVAQIKDWLPRFKSNFHTLKQFVVYAGYRYYPYLGGDPQAAADVAALRTNVRNSGDYRQSRSSNNNSTSDFIDFVRQYSATQRALDLHRWVGGGGLWQF